jgi:HEAT repeat protein
VAVTAAALLVLIATPPDPERGDRPRPVAAPAPPVVDEEHRPPELPTFLGRDGSAWADELRADPERRAEAVRLLVEGGEEASDLLEALLLQSDRFLRWGGGDVLEELVRRGDAAAVRLLAALAKGAEDSEVRERAVQALGAIGVEARRGALPAILGACRDPDEAVRVAALLALEGVWNGEAIDVVRRALREDESLIVRAAAADALLAAAAMATRSSEHVAIAPSTVLLDLIRNGEDPRKRAAAAQRLGWLGSGSLGNMLEILVDEKDPLVRGALIRAIGGLGDEGRPAVPALLEALEGPDIYPASRALMRIGAGSAIPRIAELLSQESVPARRRMLATTLAYAGDERATPVLEGLVLSSPDDTTRAAAISGLAVLGEKARSAVGTLAAELERGRGPFAVAIALARIGGAEAAAALVAAARDDSDPSTRDAALNALAYYFAGDMSSVVTALTDLLDHRVTGVRYMAAQALGRAGKPASSAIPALEKMLDSPTPWIRSTAAWALERIRGE